MPDLADILAANLRGERARKGWSQAKVASDLGVAQRTLSDIESGRELTVRELVAFCEIYGVTAADLLRDAPEGTRRALGL